jgi:hypothetical protein
VAAVLPCFAASGQAAPAPGTASSTGRRK